MTEEDVRKLLGLTRKLASELAFEISLIFECVVEHVGENNDHETHRHRSFHVHLLGPYRKLVAALHNEESREWLDSLDWTMMRLAANPQIGITSFEAVWRMATDLEQAIDRVLLADDDDRPEAIQNLQDVVQARPEVMRLSDMMQTEAAFIIEKIRANNAPARPEITLKPDEADVVRTLGDSPTRMSAVALYLAVHKVECKTAPSSFRNLLGILCRMGILESPEGSGPGSNGYGLTDFGQAINAQQKKDGV